MFKNVNIAGEVFHPSRPPLFWFHCKAIGLYNHVHVFPCNLQAKLRKEINLHSCLQDLLNWLRGLWFIQHLWNFLLDRIEKTQMVWTPEDLSEGPGWTFRNVLKFCCFQFHQSTKKHAQIMMNCFLLKSPPPPKSWKKSSFRERWLTSSTMGPLPPPEGPTST